MPWAKKSNLVCANRSGEIFCYLLPACIVECLSEYIYFCLKKTQTQAKSKKKTKGEKRKTKETKEEKEKENVAVVNSTCGKSGNIFQRWSPNVPSNIKPIN